ncbi:MAG: amidinotransferase [Porphyromonadaceae bacterium]|nr:amidinotransferase [Porphyromonadaceae bacterium]
MIEPVAFGYNPETSVNNYFQKKNETSEIETQKQALLEFQGVVDLLRNNGVNVIVIKDNPFPHTPDSIFPNNWISFHLNNHIIFYPMFAENRRLERRMDILLEVERKLDRKFHFTDYSMFEKENIFLEGTGSIVPDRKNRIAYASISPRTDKNLFLKFCSEQNFRPVFFNAFQPVNGEQLPIFHTNVIMCVADRYAVVCLEVIPDDKERKMLQNELENSGKEIVEITIEQMNGFAGNMLQLINAKEEKLLVMSLSAYNSLTDSQIERLKNFNRLLVAPIPTIEQNGGGSVRCMIAEIF